MPLDFVASLYLEGIPEWMPDPWTAAKYIGTLGALAGTKLYCAGTANTAERTMHGRVVMITGGTSGIGAKVALDLAKRGAHIVLLTAQPPSDPFVVDYVDELRTLAGHQLIYAEQVDLASLHSVRTFATKWIDNLPVRRLDMVILCAAVEGLPQVDEAGRAYRPARGMLTQDGIERAWQVNYLANFHLLAILSPALRAQPFDRDVRVIVPTCSAYIGSPPVIEPDRIDRTKRVKTETEKNEARDHADKTDKTDKSSNKKRPRFEEPPAMPDWTPARAYARSKLALMVFARSFQKHVDAYKRPDGLPGNVRVLVVDPGVSRTPGFRRWLTGGSLWALVLVYVLLYPVWWLLVKSADDGAQSVLFAAMEGDLRRMRDLGTPGESLADAATRDPLAGKVIKECRLLDMARRDGEDEVMAQQLWEESDALVEEMERRGAERRAKQEAKAGKTSESKTAKTESKTKSKTASRPEEQRAKLEELVRALEEADLKKKNMPLKEFLRQSS